MPVPHQKLQKGFQMLQFCFGGVLNCAAEWQLCIRLCCSQKEQRPGPLRTGSTGQVLIKHHPNVALLGHISVHCLSPNSPSKWAGDLPNSLHISFLQMVLSKASLLFHPKGGEGRDASAKSFCEHPRSCPSSRQSQKQDPDAKIFQDAEEKILSSEHCPSEIYKALPLSATSHHPHAPHPTPAPLQIPDPPTAPKLIQRHWNRVAFLLPATPITCRADPEYSTLTQSRGW